MTQNPSRIIRETGLEARIAGIVEPVVEDLGYRLVRVKLSALNGQTLQVMAERPDGTMSVEDCEAVSGALSPVLDIEDPIKDAYNLEVSSPGIDRPLVRSGDFERWLGHEAKIETRGLIDGRRRFRGKIAAAGNASVTLLVDGGNGDEKSRIELPYDNIGQARLAMNDEIVREALRRDKTMRQGAERKN